jgi:ubiquitin
MGGLDRTMTTTTAAAQSQDKKDAKTRKRGERYAALLSQCRTTAAVDLTRQVFGELTAWQGRPRNGVVGTELGAVRPFLMLPSVGDLLLAKVTSTAVDASTTHSAS